MTNVPVAVADRITGSCVCGEALRLFTKGDVAWLPDYLVLSRIAGDSANGYELAHESCLAKGV